MGNITSQKGANGKTTTTSYNPVIGLVTSINTHSQAIQYTQYKYDGFGRLRQRNNVASGVLQNFTYDNAHRLKTVSGYQPLTLTYDNNGNIRTKSNLQNGATYQYNNTLTGVAGSHAISQIGRAGTLPKIWRSSSSEVSPWMGAGRVMDVYCTKVIYACLLRSRVLL